MTTQKDYIKQMKKLGYSQEYINKEMLSIFSEVSGELERFDSKGINTKYLK